MKKQREGIPYGFSKAVWHRLELLRLDIASLDNILEQTALKSNGRLLSEWEDIWTEGCREGMAIAYDVIRGFIQDVAVRSAFEPFPIKIRYGAGAERTVKDGALLAGKKDRPV